MNIKELQKEFVKKQQDTQDQFISDVVKELYHNGYDIIASTVEQYNDEGGNNQYEHFHLVRKNAENKFFKKDKETLAAISDMKKEIVDLNLDIALKPIFGKFVECINDRYTYYRMITSESGALDVKKVPEYDWDSLFGRLLES